VSSKSQESNSSIHSQKEELIKEGVPEKNICVEVGYAANSIQNRPVFHNLIENELKENDLLLVTKIDRCSRNTLSFLKLQKKLFSNNSKNFMNFHCLSPKHNLKRLIILLIHKFEILVRKVLLRIRKESKKILIKLVFFIKIW